MTTNPKNLDPIFIVGMCQRAILRQTPLAMRPYSFGVKILNNVSEYLNGSNPAAHGRLSWVATWWKHYGFGD